MAPPETAQEKITLLDFDTTFTRSNTRKLGGRHDAFVAVKKGTEQRYVVKPSSLGDAVGEFVLYSLLKHLEVKVPEEIYIAKLPEPSTEKYALVTKMVGSDIKDCMAYGLFRKKSHESIELLESKAFEELKLNPSQFNPEKRIFITFDSEKGWGIAFQNAKSSDGKIIKGYFVDLLQELDGKEDKKWLEQIKSLLDSQTVPVSTNLVQLSETIQNEIIDLMIENYGWRQDEYQRHAHVHLQGGYLWYPNDRKNKTTTQMLIRGLHENLVVFMLIADSSTIGEYLDNGRLQPTGNTQEDVLQFYKIDPDCSVSSHDSFFAASIQQLRVDAKDPESLASFRYCYYSPTERSTVDTTRPWFAFSRVTDLDILYGAKKVCDLSDDDIRRIVEVKIVDEQGKEVGNSSHSDWQSVLRQRRDEVKQYVNEVFATRTYKSKDSTTGESKDSGILCSKIVDIAAQVMREQLITFRMACDNAINILCKQQSEATIVGLFGKLDLNAGAAATSGSANVNANQSPRNSAAVVK
jgi:hypothetical protein